MKTDLLYIYRFLLQILDTLNKGEEDECAECYTLWSVFGKCMYILEDSFLRLENLWAK